MSNVKRMVLGLCLASGTIAGTARGQVIDWRFGPARTGTVASGGSAAFWLDLRTEGNYITAWKWTGAFTADSGWVAPTSAQIAVYQYGFDYGAEAEGFSFFFPPTGCLSHPAFFVTGRSHTPLAPGCYLDPADFSPTLRFTHVTFGATASWIGPHGEVEGIFNCDCGAELLSRTVVPEPEPVSLLAIGLLGLWVARGIRRRRIDGT